MQNIIITFSAFPLSIDGVHSRGVHGITVHKGKADILICIEWVPLAVPIAYTDVNTFFFRGSRFHTQNDAFTLSNFWTDVDWITVHLKQNKIFKITVKLQYNKTISYISRCAFIGVSGNQLNAVGKLNTHAVFKLIGKVKAINIVFAVLE